MAQRPPGLLRQSDDADVLLMIGTAGHVDHGKTRLVRLLTGCETDRLKAEKERGLTIELGFAPCSLGSGLSAGIVDVPGHEHFIKNMVAGAAGMDMAVLVVAADDGVMPQTTEHLEIMQFLGVQSGMVALTKIDLATPERVEEVRREVEELTAGTFLAGASICAVSSETLEGFDEFYKTLVSVAVQARSARAEGVFRMPVERVFSPPGFGTVATGIPLAGSISIGDEVAIQPQGLRARIRGMQRFLREADAGRAGQCLALNLVGLSKDAVQRGCVVTRPGYGQPGNHLQVILTSARSLSTPLKDGEEVRLHTGTLEVQGRLALYEASSLEKGKTALGALCLEQLIPASATDRFVLRRNSPAVTVAGGVILRTLERRPRGSRASLAKELGALWDAFASAETRLEYHFRAAGALGSTIETAAEVALIEMPRARELVEKFLGQAVLTPIKGIPDRFLHESGGKAAEDRVLEAVAKHHQQHPEVFGPTPAEVAGKLHIPEAIVAAGAEALVKRSALEWKEKRLSLPGSAARLDLQQRSLVQRLEEVYREGRYATPRPDELPDLLDAPAGGILPMLDYLCQQGALVRLGKNVVLHAEWMRAAEKTVVEAIQQAGSLDSADFKTMIGSTRKYALALLDHLDAVHVTLRSGNLRRLHPAYLRKHPQLKR